jgi:mono/diheme cytochrome c family protein
MRGAQSRQQVPDWLLTFGGRFAPVMKFRSLTMRKTIRFQVALAAVVFLAGAVGFAQSSGEATYKAKCQSCHGAAGIPSAGMAKAMGVKPATDPALKSSTEAKMIEVTRNGAGKMPAFKGKLTDAQIKDSVVYFRTFAK